MNQSRNRTIAYSTLVLTGLALIASSRSAHAEDPPQALCYLESIESKESDSRVHRKTELKVRCAHADRRVIMVSTGKLRLLDGETDLIAAGRDWKKQYEEAHPKEPFFSTGPINTMRATNDGGRSVLLHVHTYAVPESGVAHLVGTASLQVEEDCVGNDASEPLTASTTVGALRNHEPIALPGRVTRRVRTTDQGSHNDSPMLGLFGDGAYVGLVDPPEGVFETTFFGKKRIVVDAEPPDDQKVTLQVCPADSMKIPVSIEAAI